MIAVHGRALTPPGVLEPMQWGVCQALQVHMLNYRPEDIEYAKSQNAISSVKPNLLKKDMYWTSI